jgi:glycosyltransferase involved in cell wall biosynthesis
MNYGGEDKVFELEHKMLKTYGEDVLTFVRRNNDLGSNRLRILKNLSKIIFNKMYLKDFSKVLVAFKPDIVHVHNTFPFMSESIAHECYKNKIPCVKTLHNYRNMCIQGTQYRKGNICTECSRSPLEWSAVKYSCYKNSKLFSAGIALKRLVSKYFHHNEDYYNQYIAVSEAVKIEHLNQGVPASKIKVKANFIRRFEPDNKGSSEFGYALYVGRLSREKGIQVLLKLWVDKQFSVPLIVVGDGPLRCEVEDMALKNKNIIYKGVLKDKKLSDLYESSLFVVIPSLWKEPFGMVAIEAFSLGLPVIAFDIGGLKDIVDHNINGYLCEPNKLDEFSEYIEKLIRDAHRRTDFGINARDKFMKKYTEKNNYLLLKNIYSEALSNDSFHV